MVLNWPKVITLYFVFSLSPSFILFFILYIAIFATLNANFYSEHVTSVQCLLNVAQTSMTFGQHCVDIVRTLCSLGLFAGPSNYATNTYFSKN